jgi:hypothetical protein
LKNKQKLFFFGVGNTALWTAAQTGEQLALYGTTRDINKKAELIKAGIEPIVLDAESSQLPTEALRSILDEAFVLVSYPPHSASDDRFSLLVGGAKSVIYISSTGVYGRQVGVVDETTAVDSELEAAQVRLAAERLWLNQGAIVLRAPGLYCPASGLHVRLRSGSYRLPAEGKNYTSRIHLKDLGRLILRAFEQPLAKQSIYLVGDLQPASQLEVVSWLCAKMNLAMPPSAPLDAVPQSLRGNRRVSAAKILSDLAFELEFPTYREGFAHCLNDKESLKQRS